MMTLQTQRMLNQLHPKVRELVLACNAQIEVDSGWRLHSEEGGAYTCAMNKIWVNGDFDRYKDKFNLIVLHELVHWTGHSARMARPIVVTSEQGNHRDLTEAQIHTEEMTAQQGAQKLAEQFGIVTNDFLECTSRYSLMCHSADPIWRKDVEAALKFLNGFIQSAERKAA